VKHHENEHVPSSGLVPVENREPRVRVHGLRAGVSSGYCTRTRVTRDGHTAGLAKPVACPTDEVVSAYRHYSVPPGYGIVTELDL
jgi:hypothetical protein